MILDEQSTERSALYALEMLEGDERERFERDARINPELAACTAEFRDLAAGVAVAATPKLEAPPVTVLTGALERIGASGHPPAAPARSLRLPVWSGGMLAACAALVLLVGGGVTVLKLVGGGGDTKTVQVGEGGSEGQGDQVIIMKNGKAVASFEASDRRLDQLLEKWRRMETIRATPEVVQNIARLEDQLKSLRRVDAALHTPGPRKAVRLYFEMVVPGTETVEDIPLTERVDAVDYEIGQAGTGTEPVEKVDGGEPGDEPADPVILRPDHSGVIPEVDPGEDRPVYFYDLPTGHDRFEPIDEGRLWDAENNLIWVETSQPGVYQGLRPPDDDDFDPDVMRYDHPDFPAAGSLPAPAEQADAPIEEPPAIEVIEPELVVPETIAPEVEVVEPSPPVAVTSYEQTTGRGLVMISNLPPAGEGETYHFWMRNAADDQEVNIGKLLLEDGSEHFEFDLLGPGITPSGFFITLETEEEVLIPSETVILQGP